MRGARQALTETFRDVSVGGIASLVSGIVVLGLGGRLVMFLSRVLHPEAIGRLTENGNEIGVFTVDGTLGLLIFGGITGGLAAAPVWVVMKPWIPKRWAVVGIGAVSIGGFQLVASDNPDFDILQGPAVDLVLLLTLVFVFGVVVYLLDRFLDDRLPRGDRAGSMVFYALVTVLGLLFAPLGLVLQFTSGFTDRVYAPIWTAVFVCATALVTLWWWVDRARGTSEPTPVQRRLGSGFAAGAALVGLLHLTFEIVRIL
ncbi:MAG TPA: hypothetical protein VFU96_08415 [Acidimicrobiia bacterium]|nr:hypothetical protein [Acidimicrobiia bacterium]